MELRLRLTLLTCISTCLGWMPAFGAISVTDTDDLGAVLGPGVQCLLTPTSAYKPGTIFRINGQHVSYFVNRAIAERIPTHPERAEVGTIAGRSEVSAGVVGWLLRAGTPVNAKVSGGTRHTINVEFHDISWEVTDDSQIDQVVDWFSAYKHKYDDSEYFVVREAWLVGSMRMRLTDDVAGDVGFGASLAKLLRLNTWLKYNPSAQYNLSGVYPIPLRVCIKPERLVADAGRGSQKTYRAETIGERLVIVRQEEDKN